MNEISTDYNSKPWIKMSVEDLTTPKAGKICFHPAYWALTDDGCVLFYKSYGSPQCNMNEEIVKRIRPALKVIFIEIAFVPHTCSDYN
ncbi:MAG TPA: hypothetical protein VES38_06595 [Methylotenera sp.]|nr:hypothetical protein [Methylotenera sp.]